MYMDHFGTNLHVLSDEFACYEDNHSWVSNMSKEMEDVIDLTDFTTILSNNIKWVTHKGVGVTQKHQNEDDTSVESNDNVPDVDVKTRFNEVVP